MLARKFALIAMMNGVGLIGGWIALKFIAVYLGPGTLGIVAFGLAIVGVFELLGDVGLGGAFIKRLSEGRQPAAMIGTFRVVKLALLAAMAAALALGLAGWTLVLGRPLTNTTAAVIALCLAYSVLRGLLSLWTNVFDARLETAKTQMANLAEHVVRVPAVVVVALLVASTAHQGPFVAWPTTWTRWVARYQAEWLALTYVLGAAAALAVAAWVGRAIAGARPSRVAARSLWRFALPTVLVSVVATLSGYIDRLALGYYWTESEVGQFFAGQRLTGVLVVIPSAVAGLLFPTVSERHAALDRSTVLRVVTRAERYSTLLVAPAVVFALVLAPPIVDVFLSAQFQAQAAELLFLLGLVALVQGLFQLHVALLAGMDRPGLQARASLLAFGLNIALNLLLIPDRGIVLLVPLRGPVGAALATLVAFAAGLAYLMYHAWRLTGKAPSRHVGLQLVAAVGVGLLLAYARGTFTPGNALELAAVWFLFFGLYLAALWLLRELGRDEIRMLWAAVHPGHMRGYLRDELGRPPRR